jgi:hypothetical protein
MHPGARCRDQSERAHTDHERRTSTDRATQQRWAT